MRGMPTATFSNPGPKKICRSRSPHAVERHHLKLHNRELRKKLNLKNLELEDRVSERTAELAMTNQTLTAKVEELERTRYELTTLQGLLSICSYYKKIRDFDEVWVPVEEYLHRHADILLTYGICHNCYSDVMKNIPGEVAEFLGKEK